VLNCIIFRVRMCKNQLYVRRLRLITCVTKAKPTCSPRSGLNYIDQLQKHSVFRIATYIYVECWSYTYIFTYVSLAFWLGMRLIQFLKSNWSGGVWLFCSTDYNQLSHRRGNRWTAGLMPAVLTPAVRWPLPCT
jgi:hypothetical protein